MLRIQKISIKDKKYPGILKEIDTPPLTLWVIGSLESLNSPAVSVVGSRKMSPYGKKIAELFSSELARENVTIISGLARGIDSVAHRAALRAGGKTIAVLGSGLDIIYPPENKELAKEILKKDGALISEFPPGTKPLGENFPRRNRIISGLTRVLLVVEGTKRSGTLVTASFAANQGREVFAVPGPIDNPQSFAPLYLIDNGAKIAKRPSDIMEELAKYEINNS